VSRCKNTCGRAPTPDRRARLSRQREIAPSRFRDRSIDGMDENNQASLRPDWVGSAMTA
jgi:hypothetical protein